MDEDKLGRLKTLTGDVRKLASLAEGLAKFTENGKEDEDVGDSGQVPSKDDFSSFTKLLNDSAKLIEDEINKLVLGWPSMRTAEQVDSLLASFLKRMEMVVTCAHLVYANPSVCCYAARKESAHTVHNLIASVLNVLLFLESDPDIQTSLEKSPPLVGAVWDACKAVRLVPKTNSGAAKRVIFRSALTIKDIHTEFTQVAEQSLQEGTRGREPDETDDTNRGSTTEGVDEPEMGSDEWYEMMDALEAGDSMDDEDRLRLDLVLEFIPQIGRVLQNAAQATGATPEWFQVEGRPLNTSDARFYITWLNGVTTMAQTIQDSTNSLGMTLYPPHDRALLKQAISKIKDDVRLLMASFDNVAAKVHPESLQRLLALASVVESFEL